MTVRWVLRDVETDEQWTMPINPDSMSSPDPKRTLRVAGGLVTRRRRVFEGPPPPIEWEWGGAIRTKAHYDSLESWAAKGVEVDVTDHLGRTFRVAITDFVPQDRRPTTQTPWRLRYTMKATILRRLA